MKRMILVAVVIVTACLNTVFAQTPAVSTSFGNQFKTATDVRWVKFGNIYQSRFHQDSEYCLAYFKEDGELILSGRKISFDIAPLAVKKEMQRIREKAEKKNDLLTVAEVYELTDAHETKYFINLDSETLSISVMAYGNGKSEILKTGDNKKSVQSNPVIATDRR